MNEDIDMAKIFTIVIMALCISITSAYSHHGSNSNPVLYLSENLLELEGEVTRVFWRNPHPRIMISVIDENGEEKEWELEMGGNINTYTAQGLDNEFLKVGDRVKAAGVVSRRDDSSIGLLNLLMPNGEEMVSGRRDLMWSNERLALNRKPLDPEAVRQAEATADGSEGYDVDEKARTATFNESGTELIQILLRTRRLVFPYAIPRVHTYYRMAVLFI